MRNGGEEGACDVRVVVGINARHNNNNNNNNNNNKSCVKRDVGIVRLIVCEDASLAFAAGNHVRHSRRDGQACCNSRRKVVTWYEMSSDF
jgi:hypothetical protein